MYSYIYYYGISNALICSIWNKDMNWRRGGLFSKALYNHSFQWGVSFGSIAGVFSASIRCSTLHNIYLQLCKHTDIGTFQHHTGTFCQNHYAMTHKYYSRWSIFQSVLSWLVSAHVGFVPGLKDFTEILSEMSIKTGRGGAWTASLENFNFKIKKCAEGMKWFHTKICFGTS